MQERPQLHLATLEPHEKDRLFAEGPYPVPFAFNQEVAEVFDDMVSRSVPLYQEVQLNLLEWAHALLPERAAVYDLGCSTGTTLSLLGSYLPQTLDLTGVDSSPPMLAKARAKLRGLDPRHTLTLANLDILEMSLVPCDMVIMNYTLQFIPVRSRLALLQKIYASLKPGGVFFLSEKVRSLSPLCQELNMGIYENFKRRAGYSQTEIARKKAALDHVLVPLSVEDTCQLLKSCGFHHTEILIKWNSFVSLLAIKEG